MELNLSPVEISVNIENSEIKSDAFYNVCFISENQFAPRTIEVFTLKDLLDNGYQRSSMAYNFCTSVFMQQGVKSVILRAKRYEESYEQAFDSDDNSKYYYVVIDSKDITKILNFNTHINNKDSYKLQFFSFNKDVSELILNRKIVYYYSPFSVTEIKNWSFDKNSLNQYDSSIYVLTELDENLKDYYLNKSYGANVRPYLSDGYKDNLLSDGLDFVDYDGNNRILLEPCDLSYDEVTISRSAYPEASWIAKCGCRFPSKTQWLHKFLANVDTHTLKNIPYLSTTSVNILNKRSTEGSGLTGQGIVINEQVSLDWVRYAISKNVWGLLYQSLKVNSTDSGKALIENKIKEVLDISVREGIFSDYKITARSVYPQTNNATFKFNATLTYSILNCNISGTVYN